MLSKAFILAGMRYGKDEAAELFLGVNEMEESSTHQLILERGELREARATLLRLGRTRLGEPNETTLSTIQEMSDLERMHRMTDRVFGAAGWQEVLAVG